MASRMIKHTASDLQKKRLPSDLRGLTRKILSSAHRGLSRSEFLRELSVHLLSIREWTMAGFWLREKERLYAGVGWRGETFNFEFGTVAYREGALSPAFYQAGDELELIAAFLGYGAIPVRMAAERKGALTIIRHGSGSAWSALLPLAPFGDIQGVLVLKSPVKKAFTTRSAGFFDDLASMVAMGLMSRRVQVALRERVKELTCLYGIAKIVSRHDISLPRLLRCIASLLPPAMLNPEIASARVSLDGEEFRTRTFSESPFRLRSYIDAGGERRGFVEVLYEKAPQELDEGPFLREERKLLDAVAREITLVIDRKRIEDDRSRAEVQLRHADRLATIGQLAAGVAHELNEPLGSILGFAQLAQKSRNLPQALESDMERIVNASLNAREIVRKLLFFARQMPPAKSQVSLNTIVDEGLFFCSSRCARAGIELVTELSPDLPLITADRGQIHQVIVNLAVNALQAMPGGGSLTVRTAREGEWALLAIEDTGPGIDASVLPKIFIPFFTTKDVNEGTGLGLSVVHGIITAHDGIIHVTSTPGKGTRFEVRLPLGEGRGAAQ
ncbi:MAG: ATP-binding protein [Candidatus Eremiobacteraeota bacterium]|nr:ATP-binding protein [Candidatus Eremiobacteraeota bacterium]